MGVGQGIPFTLAGDDIDNEEFRRVKDVAVVALTEGLKTVDQIKRMEELLAQNYENLQSVEREEVPCSEPRELITSGGTTWTYVIVNDEHVRILSCATRTESLVIPDQIEGMPVLEIGVDACARLETVREIICSPQIVRIGNCAFRMCSNLERLVLPRDVANFDSFWIRKCDKLTDLTLPGMWERITPKIFEEGSVQRLTLGMATRDFVPGVFARGKLEQIRIADDNPYLETDGQAIFSHDGRRLRMLAIGCAHYEVPAGCEVVEKKAFSNREELQSVQLPSSLVTIEDYAFSYSGLEEFVAPPALRSIGERAFFRCRKLKSVSLNEGLVSLGNDVFTGTGITKLEIPSTLESLGNNIAQDTRLSFSGADAGFTIAPNGILEVDEAGGLYRKTSAGKHFVTMLDSDIKEYAIKPGTVEIEPQAFAHHESLECVRFPEGLLCIGEEAFRGCRKLTRADFPDSLEEVSKEAFLDTSLEGVRIPCNLQKIGNSALVTHGAHNGDGAPSLKAIEVDPQNERFYSVPGLLIERRGDLGSRVLVYSDGVERVIIPDDVTAIEPYAFGGARHLRELTLSDRITYVGMRGLSLDCFVEHFHVDLADPLEGHDSFDFYFPSTSRSAHEIKLAFNLSNSVDLARIFKHYDSAIVNMHEFDQGTSAADGEVDAYVQAKLALGRLADPVLMSSTNKIMLTQVITENLEEVCEAIARHDDRQAIDDLLELGILNEDNLLGIIDHIGKLQDAAMTGYLLEVKRRMFRREAIDFEL